jgi:DNA-binding transcriptional regulator YbjK
VVKLSNDGRKEVILTAAYRLAMDTGLWAVTHGGVAARCVVPTSASTVKHYFPTKDHIWRELMLRDVTGALQVQAGDMRWLG